eukprot:PhM_4_TR9089/c0_g1_i1/m.92457
MLLTAKSYVECLKLLMFHPRFCTRMNGAYLDSFIANLASKPSAAHLRNVLSLWKSLFELSSLRCPSPTCYHRAPGMAHNRTYNELTDFIPKWTTFAHPCFPKPFRQAVRTMMLVLNRKASSELAVAGIAENIAEFLSPNIEVYSGQEADFGIDRSPHVLGQYGLTGLRCRDRVEVLCRDTKSAIDTGVLAGVSNNKLFWLPDSLQGAMSVYAELGTPSFVRSKLWIRPESTAMFSSPQKSNAASPQRAVLETPARMSPLSEAAGITPTVSVSPARHPQGTLSHMLLERFGEEPTQDNIVEALTFISLSESPIYFRCMIRDGRRDIRQFDISGVATKKYGVYFGQRIERAFGASKHAGTILGVGADGAMWWVRDGDAGCTRLALMPDHMSVYVKPTVIGAAILREHEVY